MVKYLCIAYYQKVVYITFCMYHNMHEAHFYRKHTIKRKLSMTENKFYYSELLFIKTAFFYNQNLNTLLQIRFQNVVCY